MAGGGCGGGEGDEDCEGEEGGGEGREGGGVRGEGGEEGGEVLWRGWCQSTYHHKMWGEGNI